ncbi:hypothetical protein Dimus_026156 [Dionaea muscipula]
MEAAGQVKEALARIKMSCQPPTPTPTPPIPRPSTCLGAAGKRKVGTWSVTKEEIESFWTRKRMEEEDHLLAAIKAAARIRARSLTVEDYMKFDKSLKVEENKMKEDDNGIGGNDNEDYNSEGIAGVGIKDWWTKSKYAYLNQPAIETTTTTTETRRRASSSYTPNNCYFHRPPARVVSETAYQLGVF